MSYDEHNLAMHVCKPIIQAALEERIARADDVSGAFKHFKKEVARAAEHSKTGQPISAKVLAKLEARGARTLRFSMACIVSCQYHNERRHG